MINLKLLLKYASEMILCISLFFGFWWFMVGITDWISVRIRGRRWCKKHGYEFGIFEYGIGKDDYYFVGWDAKRRLNWIIPEDMGDAFRCVRMSKHGVVEVYYPMMENGFEDAEPRGLLTWDVVFEVSKIVLLEIGKAAVVMFAEMLISKLKNKWGFKSGATKDRMEAVSNFDVMSEKEDCNIEGEEQRLVRATLKEIMEYGKCHGYRKVEDFKSNDIANIRLGVFAATGMSMKNGKVVNLEKEMDIER